MGCQGQELRQKLFDIYASNLSDIKPGTEDIFRCPTCLRDFDRSALDLAPKVDNMITFGHIIPETVGGTIRTLECGKCNSTIGSNYDRHVANLKTQIDWASMKEGTRKLAVMKNSNVKVHFSWEKGPTAIIKATNWNDPNYKKLGSQIREHGDFSDTFTVSFLQSIRERRVIAAIHSAFLMMFYCFGYEYILSPEADIIRKIIHEGKAPWEVGKMETHMPIIPDFPAPSAGILKKPKNMKSFVVLLPCFYKEGYFQVIFFPGFNGMETFNNYLKARNETAGNININITVTNKGPCPRDFCKALWEGTLRT